MCLVSCSFRKPRFDDLEIRIDDETMPGLFAIDNTTTKNVQTLREIGTAIGKKFFPLNQIQKLGFLE